ncbi:polysaccharide pyruvyl transferase family protein [Faecalicatena contorta]|uniref:polysaccharide pyruvyl transferase family protein n=1 Tax=Faecalicatena contorta TaxID=39482 RepID=UPI001F23CCE5|nr:polysaccharide pyruvyl transferase family protein [Faecalicatena contorta]MCF2684303.1 polysaccharide pyruvyl transferase family protein [Faecalicatena contorta]
MSSGVVLCYHGGSANHGCEAIIRSSAKMFGENVTTYSMYPETDIRYALDQVVDLQYDRESKIKKPSFKYYMSAIEMKLCNSTVLNTYFRWKVFFDNVKPGNVYLSTGGDNYCYTEVDKLSDYNRIIKYKRGKTVLWGCSVEPEVVAQPKIAKDLARYDLITARETISYEALRKVNSNTILVADPAFVLDRVDLPLPEGWQENNMIGINASPLILQSASDGKIAFEAYCKLIEHILDNTDCGIALIPHVVGKMNDDRIPLKKLAEKYQDSKRIVLIDDCNCMEIKGYISRCRMFVGARTHATIAAYSTCVPTLVLGYSVKSRGIAKDLFGRSENYVLPVQGLKSATELRDAFCWLMKNEDGIRKHLYSIIPEYTRSVYLARDAVYKLMKK